MVVFSNLVTFAMQENIEQRYAIKFCMKLIRLEICQDLLGRLEIEPNFLHKVITGDESWMFDYDPVTKRQGNGTRKVLLVRRKHA